MRIWDILSSGYYTEIIIVGTIFAALLIIEALLSLIIVSTIRKVERVYMLAYCILAGFIGLFGTIFLILWIDVLRPLT